MQGVGPGTVLGGRYTVHRRLQQRGGAERWSGHDDTLRREVTLLVLPLSHPQAEALLDAARRAAGVDNSHLARILDVGRADGSAYVVEEDLASAQSLASLAARGGLPAEEVRRIVGVASRALEGARLRGLHHEALTPESIVRTHDGAVKVLGLATAAALLGREGADPDTASRRDAVAVVALAYAGLTGRWPLPSDGGGLDPAPRFVSGVAAPSEIATGVPQDLDTLCRQTLVDDRGPTTPGDFARQIAPWSHEPVGDFGAGNNTSEQDGGSTSRGSGGPDRGTGRRPTPPAGSAGASDPEVGHPAYDEQDEQVEQDGPATVDEPVADTPEGATPNQPKERATGPSAATVTAALGSATSAAGQAVSAVSGRVGDFARTAVDRAQERRAAKAAAADWTEEHRVRLSDTLEAGADVQVPADAERPTVGPMGGVALLDPDAVEPLNRNESKLALAIVGGLLVLALILGIYGVSRMGSGVNLGLSGDATQTSLSSPSPTGQATGSTPSTAAPSPTGGPVAIAGIKAFDPQADRHENDAALGKVIDGLASTVWTSEGYSSANLGGLKKGVGVILDLGRSMHPSSIAVDQTTASDYTVYLADSDSLAGARKVGAKAGTVGVATLPVPAGVTGRYVIVWFTKVAPASGGRFRASLAEVKVTG